MADDDMNGSGEARGYSDAATAQLGERVTNLGRRQSDLEAEMRSGFRAMESAFSSFSNETRTSIAGLSASIAERSKPQWQALSVMLAAMVVLGGLLYWPIRETTTDIKTTLSRIGEVMVTRQELNFRSERGAEDRSRNDEAFKELRMNTVARTVWEERNHARDVEIADIGRRIDEMRREVGAVYGTRDIIIDLKKEIDNLRQRLNSRSYSPPT